MITVKKSENTSLKAKSIMIIDDQFCDSETGEAIDLIKICSDCFGTDNFDISISQKFDRDLPTE